MHSITKTAALLGMTLQFFAEAHAVSTAAQVPAETPLMQEPSVGVVSQWENAKSLRRSLATIAVAASLAVVVFLILKCMHVLKEKRGSSLRSERFLAVGGAGGGDDDQPCSGPPPPATEAEVEQLKQDMQAWNAAIAGLLQVHRVELDEEKLEETLLAGQRTLAPAIALEFDSTVSTGLREQFRATLHACSQTLEQAAALLRPRWSGMVDMRREYLSEALQLFLQSSSARSSTVPVESYEPVVRHMEDLQSSLEAATALHSDLNRFTLPPIPSGNLVGVLSELFEVITNAQSSIHQFVHHHRDLWRNRIRQAEQAGMQQGQLTRLRRDGEAAMKALTRASGLDVSLD